MITHQAICKNCGNQTEVDRNTKSFQAVFKVYPLKDHTWNDTFGNNWTSGNKKSLSPDQVDCLNESFCDKECFIEHLKEKMTDNGILKLSQEEIDQMEEEQPEENKRIANALRSLEDLEMAASSGENKK